MAFLLCIPDKADNGIDDNDRDDDKCIGRFTNNPGNNGCSNQDKDHEVLELVKEHQQDSLLFLLLQFIRPELGKPFLSLQASIPSLVEPSPFKTTSVSF